MSSRAGVPQKSIFTFLIFSSTSTPLERLHNTSLSFLFFLLFFSTLPSPLLSSLLLFCLSSPTDYKIDYLSPCHPTPPLWTTNQKLTIYSRSDAARPSDTLAYHQYQKCLQAKLLSFPEMVKLPWVWSKLVDNPGFDQNWLTAMSLILARATCWTSLPQWKVWKLSVILWMPILLPSKPTEVHVSESPTEDTHCRPMLASSGSHGIWNAELGRCILALQLNCFSHWHFPEAQNPKILFFLMTT